MLQSFVTMARDAEDWYFQSDESHLTSRRDSGSDTKYLLPIWGTLVAQGMF